MQLLALFLCSLAPVWGWQPAASLAAEVPSVEFSLESGLLIKNKRDNDDQNGYSPYHVDCPADRDNFNRKADQISPSEKEWLQSRDKKAHDRLKKWLQDSDLDDDTNLDGLFSNTTSLRLGLAFSGGGYRAMLCGAGQLSALDERDAEQGKGHMGGLLQSATHLAGLSGGSWLVNSLVVNNWTSVAKLHASDKLWKLEDSIINPHGYNIFKGAGYWAGIARDVISKKNNGYNASITDIWGRALSHQFFGFEGYGKNVRYHYIRDYEAFTDHEMPFPVVLGVGRAPGTTVIGDNSTVIEFNPYEMGSWDPTLYTFTDIEFIGTRLENGKPTSKTCTNGLDNVGFVTGTSSSLFNQALLRLKDSGGSSVIVKLIELLLKGLSDDSNDIASYDPNPFYKSEYAPQSGPIQAVDSLSVVDGGEDGQNVPLVPLIQPARNLDIILAFDNSADTQEGADVGPNWPDGASLMHTYERQFSKQGNNTIFPYVPTNETFLYGGLSTMPTFFGCSKDNLTSLFNDKDHVHHYPPVIVYMGNAEHSAKTNWSTFKMEYEKDEVTETLINGYNLVTQNNGTIDKEWRTCLGCAVVLREQQRQGIQPSEQCQKCFDRYCWDGKTVTAEDANHQVKRRDGKSNQVKDADNNGNDASSETSGSSQASATGSGSSSKNAAPAEVFNIYSVLGAVLLSIL